MEFIRFCKVPKTKPAVGATRVKRFFAILPVSISNGEIIRTKWLQTVTVEQEYAEIGMMLLDFGGYPVYDWVNKRFC